MKILGNFFMILGWLWFLPRIFLLIGIKTGVCLPREDLFTGFFGICDFVSMVSLIQMIIGAFGVGRLALFILIIGIVFGGISLYKTRKYFTFSSIFLYLSIIFVLFEFYILIFYL